MAAEFGLELGDAVRRERSAHRAWRSHPYPPCGPVCGQEKAIPGWFDGQLSEPLPIIEQSVRKGFAESHAPLQSAKKSFRSLPAVATTAVQLVGVARARPYA